MNHAKLDHHRPVRRTGPNSFWPGLLLLVFLLLSGLFTAWQMEPPAPVSATAPATEFSAERALQLLPSIAGTIHPNGTPEHDQVRDYILAQVKQMGLTAEIQQTTAFHKYDNANFNRAGQVENIIVRIKGQHPTGKAVMFSAHYDSTAHSHGASKDGVAVAAMLETMRALRTGAPVQNDLIFLFTDGTENFWMGSNGFVNQSPVANDVGVVFNFESRGSSGPVFMFETTDNNGWLVSQFGQAVSHPVANSMFYSIYKLGPYNTDFTAFRRIPGVEGLNFAFIGNQQNFRTGNDTLDKVDVRSMQQDGEDALALAKHFGNLNLAHPQTGNLVFFSIGTWFVHYSTNLVWPLTILTLLVFFAVFVYGMRKKEIRISGVLLGFFGLLLFMIVAAAVAQLIDMAVSAAIDPFALTSNKTLYMCGFVLLTIAISSALYAWFRRKISLLDLSLGAMLWWLLLLVATTIFMPEGSFLFAWPLLFGLLGLFYMLRAKEQQSIRYWLVLLVAAIPAMVLFVPMIYIFYLLLDLSVPGALMALVVLLFGLLLPQLQAFAIRRQRTLPLVSVVVSLCLLVVAICQPPYSAASPKPNVLIYGNDLDTGKAYYGTVSHQDIDQFLKPYLAGGQISPMDQFFPEDIPDRFITKPAPVAPADPPLVQTVSDTTADGVRTLHLRIGSNQILLNTTLSVHTDRPIASVLVDGHTLKNQDTLPTRWQMIYTAPKESGFDLVLTLQPNQKVQVRVTDATSGFPAALGINRPPSFVPTYYSDISYVTKTFSY